MAWALNDIKDAMRAHGFTDMLDSDMEAIINDAYFDVCSRDTWPFLEKTANITISAGQGALTSQPTDLGSVLKAVIDATGTPLMPIRLDDFTTRFAGMLGSVGQPYYYYFIDDQMYVYPNADTTYTLTLRYLATPQRLDNSLPGTSDIPLIPDRHRRVILLGSLVSANAMEDDTDLAAWFEQQFEARLARMTQDLWKKQWDRPDMIYALDDWDYTWQ